MDTQARSLTYKRRVLADPDVARALSLIRRSLTKPGFYLVQETNADSHLQQSRSLRTVARLLALQQFVLLADGRVGEALDVAAQGMRVGRLVYASPEVPGLLGQSMATGSLRTLAAHLDQLSATDCDRLYRLCVEWLRQADPQTEEMTAVRKLIPKTVAEIRAKLTAGGLPALEKLQVYEEEIPDDVRRALSGPAASLDVLYAAVERRLDEIQAHNLAQLRKPPWERTWDFPPDDGSVGAQLAALIGMPYDTVSDAYTRGSAFIQLAACHCAIRRYRWEYDRLPAGLDELSLGEVAVDPFTGAHFRYEVRGVVFRLTSAGPVAEDGDPQAVEGRLPFSAVPGDSW